MKDVLAALRDVQVFAEGLAAAMTEVRAEVGPVVEAAGADRTGTIRVWVGTEGLPNRAAVDPGWRDQLSPSRFGEAVMQAGRAAAAEQLRQIQEIRSSNPPDARRWAERMDRLRTASADRVVPEAPTVPPAVVPGVAEPSGQGGPAGERGEIRDLGLLAEDVLGFVSRHAQAEDGPLGRSGTGEVGQGQLMVTVSADGELTCRASASWVDRQDPATLGTALTDAMGKAQAELRGVGLRTEADGLLADLLGLLEHPERLLPEAHPMRPSTEEKP